MDRVDAITAAVVFAGCGAILALVFTLPATVWKSEAIAHHAAHYDGQTGKFVWNDEVKP